MPVELRAVPRPMILKSRSIRKWFKLDRVSISTLRLGALPDLVTPETLVKTPKYGVELMLCCLMEGFWIPDGNWRDYGRLVISSRMRKKQVSLFHGPFEPLRADILDFQLNGGTLKTQKKIKELAQRILATRVTDNYLQAASRLCLSLCDDNQINTCIHPLHWIRATLASIDRQPTFGMAAYQVEQRMQKKTLCELIYTELPDNF